MGEHLSICLEMDNKELVHGFNFLKSHRWDIWNKQWPIGPSGRRLQQGTVAEWGQMVQGFSPTSPACGALTEGQRWGSQCANAVTERKLQAPFHSLTHTQPEVHTQRAPLSHCSSSPRLTPSDPHRASQGASSISTDGHC